MGWLNDFYFKLMQTRHLLEQNSISVNMYIYIDMDSYVKRHVILNLQNEH